LISENGLRMLARKNKVTTGLMEKDYVNSWILYSIFTEEELSDYLVFKGGTALHKIYFPDIWRFSEDIDLTVIKQFDEDLFKDKLKSSLSESTSRSRIGFEIISYHSNPGYIQIKIQYDALLGQKNTTKLDLSLSEKILFETLTKEHSFEDVPSFSLPCYSIEEIFVEKLRSLFQRNKARDYYDVYRLWNEQNFELEDLVETFKVKMELKNLSLNLEISKEKRQDLEDYWEKALIRFISNENLPDFNIVMNQIDDIIGELKEIDEDFS